MSNSKISPKNPLPTPFTQAIGLRIRQAREEHGLSQMQLAQRIERRQAAVSEMELGRMEPDATTLAVLVEVLEKPISYFFPPPFEARSSPADLTAEEEAMLLQFRRLQRGDYRQIAINQVTALADFDS